MRLQILDERVVPAVEHVIAEARQFGLVFGERLEQILAAVVVAQGELGVIAQAVVQPDGAFVLLHVFDRVAQIVARSSGQIRLREQCQNVGRVRRNARRRNGVVGERLAGKWIDYSGSETRKISFAHGQRGNGSQLRQALTFLQTFVTGEEKRGVLHDGPAQGRAKLVADELRLDGAVEKVARIQIAVAQIIVQRSVEFVAAAARDDVHLPGRRHAIFGAVGVGRDFELLNRVHRRLEHVAAHVGIVVVHAIQQEVVVFFPAAVGVHGEIAACRELRTFHRRRGAGKQQRKLQEIPFVERKAFHQRLIQHRAEFARIIIGGGRLGRNSDMFAAPGQS